jgi:DNA-binding NarL/FixJ family response regulator
VTFSEVFGSFVAFHGSYGIGAGLELTDARMTQPQAVHDPAAQPIRVLLVCSERVIRAAVRALIDGRRETCVIDEVEDLHAALDLIVAERPDVTVLDPDHYHSDDVADLMRAAVTKTRIILLTGLPSSTPIAQAVENGAVGLVLKQQPPELLLKAIDKVHAGELWLDRTATARLIAELSYASQAENGDAATGKAARLTQRERQVIRLVGAGLRNSQIARRLCISEVTVRNHLTATFRKLELENRFQLVFYAFQHGLATLPARANAAQASDDPELEYRKKTS